MSSRFLGFTLIELIITIGIILLLTSVVFSNYTSFTTRSNLRIRVSEVAELIRFSQERSASTEILDSTAILPSQGFQSVRLLVRDGILESFRLEKVHGIFTNFGGERDSDGESINNFEKGRERALGQESRVNSVVLQPQEEFFIDVCFIDSNGAIQYVRKPLEVGSAACASATPTYMLCREPNPASPTYNSEVAENNNFDIYLSIEQPSREVYGNVFPVLGNAENEIYQYSAIQPAGPNILSSPSFDGIRIVFITRNGSKRSIDVYQTGLVSTKANTTTSGCE